MNQVTLAGQEIYPIGIGTWKLALDPGDREEEIRAIRIGLDQGAQLIDMAEMYSQGDAEILVGQAIFQEDRDQLFLTSKFLPSNAADLPLRQALEGSLQRIKTDYLDLYLLHWQTSNPMEEAISTLEDLKSEGKIRAWGISNFDRPEFGQVLKLPGGEHCATNQVQYNLRDRGIEYDLKPFMQERDIPLMAYSPIGQGGFDSFTPEQDDLIDRLAQEHHASIFQIYLAWVIRDGNTIAIPRTSQSQHMEDNIAAGQIQFSQNDLRLLAQAFPSPRTKQPFAIT